MWKIGTHFKSTIIFLFVVFICQEISASEQLPPLTELSALSNNSSCISISGKYQFNGVAVPQMPLNFRGRPFTMDVMTGLDLPYNDRNKVTYTNIQQLGNKDLLFRFYDLDKLVGEKTLSPSAKLRIICSKDMITIIEENKETMGEAVYGVVNISTKLSLSEGGSLILDAIFNGTDKYFFNLFSRKYTEKYIIMFGRIDR